MPQKQTISDLLLEQYVLGELSAAQERRVREELAQDADLRARLAALSESDRQILADYPPERIVPAIRDRMREPDESRGRARWGARVLWALPVAAALVLALSLGVFSNETRMKGMSPHLSVFRKTPSGAEELRPGSLARPGDVLQLSYAAAGAKYAAILSIDGRGAVTWHLPPRYGGGARGAAALEPQGRVVLPTAYELDDAPGFERFFLVFSGSSFDLAGIERAARALAARPAAAETGSLALPRGLGQVSLLLKKQGL